MGFGLWETLLRPDQEEQQHPERTEVARAANHLQVGEFQLLQLAYREWHDQDLPIALVDRLFNAYMLHDEVPHWARHYARQINRLADEGRIHDQDPRYHRYDHEYVTHVPEGRRKFAVAVGIVAVCFAGAIMLAQNSARRSLTILPPYFDETELKTPKPNYDGFGRADSVHPRPGP